MVAGETSTTNAAQRAELQHCVRTTQVLWGLSFGFYIFIYGPWFYECFGGELNDAVALSFTAALLAIRQVGIAVFELPAGFLADKMRNGRQRLVTSGFAFRLLFFAGLAVLAPLQASTFAFPVAVAASVAFAAGYSAFNGAFAAWVASRSRAIAPPSESPELTSRMITEGHVWMFGAELVAGVISVLAYQFGVPAASFAFGIVACVAGTVFSYGHLADDSGCPATPRAVGKGWKQRMSAAHIVVTDLRVVGVIVLLFAGAMFLVNIVEYLWPVALRSKVEVDNRGWVWMGILLALSASRLWGARLAGKAWVRAHLEMVFVLLATLGSGSVIALSFLTDAGQDNVWMLGFVVVVVVFAHGVMTPSYEALVIRHLPQEFNAWQASILSLGSLLRSILVLAVAIPAAGSVADKTAVGWALPAWIVLVAACIAFVALRRDTVK